MSILYGIAGLNRVKVDVNICVDNTTMRMTDVCCGQMGSIYNPHAANVVLVFFVSMLGEKTINPLVNIHVSANSNTIHMITDEPSMRIEVVRHFVNTERAQMLNELNVDALLSLSGLKGEAVMSNVWKYFPLKGLTRQEIDFCKRTIDDLRPKKLLVDIFSDISCSTKPVRVRARGEFGRLRIFMTDTTKRMVITGVDKSLNMNSPE